MAHSYAFFGPSLVAGLALIIFILASLIMIGGIFYHRRQAIRAQKLSFFHKNIWVELMWSIAPLLIMVIAAWGTLTPIFYK